MTGFSAPTGFGFDVAVNCGLANCPTALNEAGDPSASGPVRSRRRSTSYGPPALRSHSINRLVRDLLHIDAGENLLGTMGLYGSEYWSYVLPRRVGAHRAESLVGRCEPVAAEEAVRIGLVDEVSAGPPAAFEETVLGYATRLATRTDYATLLDRKPAARAADERRRPLESYRAEELALMRLDIFDDRRGFAAARHAFVTKRTRPPGRDTQSTSHLVSRLAS